MRPTRKLDERAEQGAAQRNLNGEHHQDEQDSKVKFDTKHEGADAASGVNPSKGEAQAVKRDVRRAERREDESRREAQNIAVRRDGWPMRLMGRRIGCLRATSPNGNMRD